MKIKIKKVYYCEFCNKHSLRSDLEEHEKRCTKNPNRFCGLCGRNDITPLLAKYKNKTHEDVGIEDIADDVEGCPVCMLTIMRLAINPDCVWEFNWDYKKAIQEWWDERNKERGPYD